jgi:nucleoside-diphosphate-sugar epimerase
LNTLLIIGGTGFFGKSILDAFKRDLLNQWKINKIIIMSRNSDNFKLNYPESITQGVEIFTGDITTIDHLPNADYVIHAAASTDASRYKTKNFEEKANIIKGTLNYCRLASEFHKNSRIVFCSSGAVYGYQPKHVKYLEEDMPFGNIEDLNEVKKSYAYAKRDAEFAIQKLGQSGLNVSIARCFSFVGKYLPRGQHFAIGNFIADGFAGRDIIVKADRKVYRSYMYADDLAEWLLTLADNANINCPIFNVGSDREIEIRDLAQVVSNFFNVGVKYLSAINSSEIDRYIPSIEKAQKQLGLKENFDINSSIKRTLDNIDDRSLKIKY